MKSKIYQVEVFEDGSFNWKLDGQYHREDGPAVKWADGTEFYLLNGEFHREDGPAVKYADGSEFYYIDGQYHREDGPAVKYADGKEEYWLNNKQYSKEEFDKIILTRKNKVKKIKKSLACDNKEVIIEGVKYKLTKV